MLAPAWLPLLIAGDVAAQTGTEHGKIGVTRSARSGTGVAHEKPWVVRVLTSGNVPASPVVPRFSL